MKFGVVVPVQVMGIPGFWALVRKSRHRLLALDYDGTLAPFHVDPMQAHPLPGVPVLLKALSKAQNSTVAIISGRPVQEVATLLGDVGLLLIGCHGFEVIDRDGNFTVKSPSVEQLEAMDKAVETADRLGFKDRLEVKTASVALHTRGMPPGEASRIEEMISRAWSRIVSSHLGSRRFNGGVEIYCVGWNKGDALANLLIDSPPGTLPVYIGDDATDEDAFRSIQDKGIGIIVGSPDTPTAAKGFLPNCEAVRAFLKTWLSLTTSERSFA